MTEPETEKWDGSKEDADRITSWCHANGGEARYETAKSAGTAFGCFETEPARILVLTREGWEHCSPGQWVVMGDKTFPHPDWIVSCQVRYVREFTVESR